MIELPQDQLHLQGIDPLLGKTLIVRKRDGRHEEFNEARICLAIESAFKAVHGFNRDETLPESLHTAVKKCADVVVERVLGRAVRGEQLEVESIQDAVEDQLMLEGHLSVARCYILYREKRRLARAEREGRVVAPPVGHVAVDAPLDVPPPTARPAPSALTLLEGIYSQALPHLEAGEELDALHCAHFSDYLNEAQYLGYLAPALLDFDLEKLASGLRLERDAQFSSTALQSLRAGFLLHDSERCIETPQYFWMRIAMGLALNEGEQATSRASEFYEALSTFRFVPSESVLRHAGRLDPQLIACCNATSWSDLEHITSNPPKKGLTCSWLEPWHAGILDFLARPQPGAPPWDHDLNKALWIPDLFMKRVRQQSRWTLFDPSEAPGLHELHGRAFEERYLEYEKKAERGEMTGHRQLKAVDLWQEILASLAQTGQPWIGFKDTASIRSPCDQKTVRSGGLCTSILFNTSANEAPACSLGAINLGAHLIGTQIDQALLQSTISAAMRMLDNALDLSSYPLESTRSSCREHRSAGLGVVGFQDALEQLGLNYGSAAAAEFADCGMELISYHAILSSVALARERGSYPSYAESKWSRGLLPIDTLALLNSEREFSLNLNLSMVQGWKSVRASVLRHGLRHSTVTAISPDRAGTQITGVSPSIEPAPQSIPSPEWLVECAARRQKWLDMGQAFTLYAPTNDLSALSEIYIQAWEKGVKTVRQLYCQKENSIQTRPKVFTGYPAHAEKREAIPLAKN
jgi:ribonucleotide reductase alpha subunit